MDIQSIKKIIFPAINNAIQQMEEKDLSCNITLLKRIVNEAVDASLNRSHSHLSNIIADFSGRGRAWAKVNVDDQNPVWQGIKECLISEMNSGENNSEMYMRASNMLDLFESTGIAWMRFAGINNKSGHIRFQIRLWGSKLDNHVKVYIDKDYYTKGFVENLEGVPHNLNLECGNFSEVEFKKKTITEIDINPEELNAFGIQTIEDLIGDDLNNDKV